MKIKTYIINLKESTQRWDSVLQDVAKFPFMNIERIDAVNGKQMNEEEVNDRFDTKKFNRRYSRLPARGEIGCTLSHRKCYKQLLDSQEAYALILEDDVSFIRPEDTEHVISLGTTLLKNSDLIVLAYPRWYYNRPQRLDDRYTAYPLYESDGTYAYLINRRGAERLLTLDRASWVADDFILMRKMGIRTTVILPNIAEVRNVESTIDSDRSEKQLKSRSLFVRIKQRITTPLQSFLLRAKGLVSTNTLPAPSNNPLRIN